MTPFRVDQQSLELASDVVAKAIAQLALDVFAVDLVETQVQPPQAPQRGRARQRQGPGIADAVAGQVEYLERWQRTRPCQCLRGRVGQSAVAQVEILEIAQVG